MFLLFFSFFSVPGSSAFGNPFPHSLLSLSVDATFCVCSLDHLRSRSLSSIALFTLCPVPLCDPVCNGGRDGAEKVTLRCQRKKKREKGISGNWAKYAPSHPLLTLSLLPLSPCSNEGNVMRRQRTVRERGGKFLFPSINRAGYFSFSLFCQMQLPHVHRCLHHLLSFYVFWKMREMSVCVSLCLCSNLLFCGSCYPLLWVSWRFSPSLYSLTVALQNENQMTAVEYMFKHGVGYWKRGREIRF